MRTNLAVTTIFQKPSSQLLGGDFRLFLQREFTQRCQQNPRYSLRAFAKFLGLESSRLSKILRGQRPVSPKLVVQLGQRLQLSQAEIMEFSGRSLVPEPHAALATQRSYLPLALDLFECLEDWRHYALLELMKVKGFQTNPKWLAEKLKCSLPEVRACVERLQRTGLLEVAQDGRWVDTSDGFSTHILSETETTYAHRRSQKKILELASKSIDEVPMVRRDQSSMMMATSAAKMAEAKKRISRFRRELCEFLEDVEKKDAIYQLSISLFPLVEEKMAPAGATGKRKNLIKRGTS